MKKGFIGPIGDDIPSIFPIIGGVILFVATFALSAQIVDEKNDLLKVQRETLSLAYLATESGFVTEEDFLKNCDNRLQQQAINKGIKMLVTVKRFCDGIPLNELQKSETDPAFEFYSPYYIDAGQENELGHTWLYCSWNGQTISDLPPGLNKPTSKNTVTLTYPIAVPCPDVDSATSGIGVVNVVGWK
ncbi:hypothetical protein HUU53_02425 [Candidatus Micrarchaeota archaeon]|nr:hypothetical protein [Candidatus Micrarchaeota archaeon]